MTKKKYRRYSPEFKRHVLKRASEDGMTDQGVCDDLGISARQLRRWRDQYRLLGDEAFPGQGKNRDDRRNDNRAPPLTACYRYISGTPLRRGFFLLGANGRFREKRTFTIIFSRVSHAYSKS